MSHMSLREPRIADIMSAFCLDSPPPAPVLIMNDMSGRIAATLGLEARSWNRRTGGATPATPWPKKGAFASAILRLPKSKDELTMSLAAAHSVLAPGGKLFLYGANDEGIKSVANRLSPYFDRIVTELTKGHARVVRASRSDGETDKPTLADWKEKVSLTTPQGDLNIVSYPGVFAHTRLDQGSETLMNRLPKTEAPIRVLDFGCGTGVLSAAFLRENPEADLTLVDNDSVAVMAAQENVPTATVRLGSKMSDLGDAQFDLILSNPPIHNGKEQDFTVLEDLCHKAPKALAKGGEIRMVVQRTAPASRLLQESFAKVDLIGENKSFRIWQATA